MCVMVQDIFYLSCLLLEWGLDAAYEGGLFIIFLLCIEYACVCIEHILNFTRVLGIQS